MSGRISSVPFRDNKFTVPRHDGGHILGRLWIEFGVEVVRMRRSWAFTTDYRERAVGDLEALGTEGLAGRVLSEPDVVVALIDDVARDVREEGAGTGEDRPSSSLLFRRQSRNGVICRSANEHVLLAHTEILRLVDADTGAAEQHDVIDARYSSRFLRRRSNQSRTVRMPDRCQVRIDVGVRCAKTINGGVIRRRPLFGTFGGHDVRVRGHGRRIHAPELGRIIAEPHDRSARGIMEARVDSCVVRPLQIIASEVLVECRTEPGYVRCNVFGIVWISVGDDCPSRALIGDPEKEHLRLLRIRNSLCRVLFQGACDFFDSTEPGFSLLAVLTFQLRDQELKVLLVGLMAYRSRNSIQVADHVRITCQVLLALRIRKVVPPLLAVDWRLVERDLTPEVFVRSPTYGLHVSSSVRPRMLVHGEARSGL